MIVGDGWWLERFEYDGSEWWEYKEMPEKPNKCIYNEKEIMKHIYHPYSGY